MRKPFISLKPCPFCGQVPVLYGRERRDYVQPTTKEIAEMTDNGWAKGTAKEYWIQPRCAIGCLYGSTHATAYGIVGGVYYTTKEAAATAWNERWKENDD